MILVLAALIGVLTVPLAGGDLRRLADVELRGVWLAPLAVAIQVVILALVTGGSARLHAAIHVSTYALAVAFIWANRRLPGARLLGLGCAANLAAIIANGGVMPQTAAAHRLSGIVEHAGFDNSRVLSHPHLAWLGDVIPVPAPFGLANVLSAGDLLLFAGMLVLLHAVSGSFARGGTPPVAALGSVPALTAPPSPEPPLSSVYVDAVLAGALSTVYAAVHLWRAGQSPGAAPARRALTAFETCRRAADRLPAGDPQIGAAQDALARIAVEFRAWPAIPRLGGERELVLWAAIGEVRSARASRSIPPRWLPAWEGPLRGALPA